MKKSEIIHILKDPIKSSIEKLGQEQYAANFASKMIAISLYKYDTGEVTEEDIKSKNNFYGLADPSNGDKLMFSTVEECILQAVGAGINDTSEELDNDLESICKANNLYRFDKEIIQSVKSPIVDIDPTPNFDQYTVKDANEAELVKTMDLEEAKEVASEAVSKPAKIYNSRGVVIDGGFKEVGKKVKIRTTTMLPGTMIEANGLNMYKHPGDVSPDRAISGIFYLYDGKIKNGRYAICIQKEMAQKLNAYIYGYVNAKDLK